MVIGGDERACAVRRKQRDARIAKAIEDAACNMQPVGKRDRWERTDGNSDRFAMPTHTM